MLNNADYHIPKGSWDLEVLTSKIADITRDFSDVFVVADFDKTLTTRDSCTTWNILAKSWIIGENYSKLMSELYNYYMPFEINNEINIEEKSEKMNEWWIKALSLLADHNVNKFQIDWLVIDYINWREWVIDFFNLTNKLNIPVIIISAWIGNFIEEFFILNWINLNNISIESNFLLYDESWIVIGIDKTHVIHTFNKNNHILNFQSKNIVWKRRKTFVLWDSTGDIGMIDLFDVENYLSIWLLMDDTSLEYFDNSGFDMVNLWDDFGLVNRLLSI